MYKNRIFVFGFLSLFACCADMASALPERGSGYIPARKNGLTGSGPVMPGSPSETTRKYMKIVFGVRPLPFYEEEVRTKLDEETVDAFFEANKNLVSELRGWKISFEDFCRATEWRQSVACLDFVAKNRLILELNSKKYKKIAPEIAHAQFLLSLDLAEEQLSEAFLSEENSEKAYGPIIDWYRKYGNNDLAAEMAIFFSERQKYLAKHQKSLRARLFREAVFWYADNPEGRSELVAKYPHVFAEDEPLSASAESDVFLIE